MVRANGHPSSQSVLTADRAVADYTLRIWPHCSRKQDVNE